jgi:hypothetical protein
MDNAEFEEAFFTHWLAMPDDGEGIYHAADDSGDPYDSRGCALDSKLTMLAELFLVADTNQRQILRDHYFVGHIEPLWDLHLFARRTTLWMDGTMDDRWIMRGLAAIAIENAGFDNRETVVTLVILRFAAELAGLDFVALVDIPELQSEELYPHLEDALTPDPDEWRLTIESFGPPHLQNQLPSE